MSRINFKDLPTWGNTKLILSYIEIIIVGALVFGISIGIVFLIKNRRIQIFR